MMLRRMLSSVASKKNCSDCRLYNRATKTCKLNNLDAFTNRLNDSICGTNGKKFWALDDKYLIETNNYIACAGLTSSLALVSLVTGFIINSTYCLMTACSFFMISLLYTDLSDEAKKKYLDGEDN